MAATGNLKHLKQHRDYYLSGGDLYILISETLFRVHSYFLTRESKYFQDCLADPPKGQQPKGTTEATALVLENVTPQEFSVFLWCFYNPSYSLYNETVKNWQTILSLAQRWTCPEIKQLAIRQLENMDIPPVDRIVIYHKYEVPQDVLIPYYSELCTQDYPPTVPESMKLGLESAVIIFQARERLRASPNSGDKSPLPNDVPKDEVLKIVEDVLSKIVTSGAAGTSTANGNANTNGTH